MCNISFSMARSVLVKSVLEPWESSMRRPLWPAVFCRWLSGQSPSHWGSDTQVGESYHEAIFLCPINGNDKKCSCRVKARQTNRGIVVAQSLARRRPSMLFWKPRESQARAGCVWVGVRAWRRGSRRAGRGGQERQKKRLCGL